ncbi:hypothetical protein BGX24_001491 [Mortierella sp. AD032]|nr:hypothetical protein BGX24_001491 [Mortierella sp. AD032]
MTLNGIDSSAEERHSQHRDRQDDRADSAQQRTARSCRGNTTKDSTRYNDSSNSINSDSGSDYYSKRDSGMDTEMDEDDANADQAYKNIHRRNPSIIHRQSSDPGLGQKRSGNFAIEILNLTTKHARPSDIEEAEQHGRVRNNSLIYPRDAPSSGIVFCGSDIQNTNPKTEAWLNTAIKYDLDLGRLRYVHPNPELVLNHQHLEMLEAAFQVHKDNLDFLTEEDFEFFAAITGITYKATKKWFLQRTQDIYQAEASPSSAPGLEPPAPSRRFIRKDRITRAFTGSFSSNGEDIATINVEPSAAIIEQDDESMDMLAATAEPDTTVHDVTANIELPGFAPTSTFMDVNNSDAIVKPVKDTVSCNTAHTPTAIDVEHRDTTAKTAKGLKFCDVVVEISGDIDFGVTVVEPAKVVECTSTVFESTNNIESKCTASAVAAKNKGKSNSTVANPANLANPVNPTNPARVARVAKSYIDASKQITRVESSGTIVKLVENRSSSEIVELTKHDSNSGTIVKSKKREYNSHFVKSTNQDSNSNSDNVVKSTKHNASSNTVVEQTSTALAPTINTRTKSIWPEDTTINITRTDKHNDAANRDPVFNFTSKIGRPPLKTYSFSKKWARQGSGSPTVVVMPRVAAPRASPAPPVSSSAESGSENTSPSTEQSHSHTDVIVRNPIQSKHQALQEQKCLEARTKQLCHGDGFYKEACKPCMEQQGDIICSFEKFRLFRVDNKDDKGDITKYRYGPDFFSNPSLDKPLRFRRNGLDQEMACYIFAHTFPFGLTILEKELLHVMGRPGHTLRKMDLREGPPDANAYIHRPSDDRQYCERCNGAIVAGYWMCCVCGDEICLDCYAFCETTVCTKERQHQQQQFVSCGKFRATTLQTYIAKLRELERDLTPEVIEIAKMATLRSATVATPKSADKRPIARLPVIIDMEDLDLDTFQRSWRQGQVLVVGGVGRRLRHSWTPEYLISNHGDAPVTAIRCQDSATDLTDMATYFSTYFKAGKSRAVWRMGVWPDEPFQDVLPEMFKDLLQSLPVPEYTSPSGALNLVKYFPLKQVNAEISAKLYISQRQYDTHRDFGPIQLSAEMSDSIYICTHTEAAETEKALWWDIYRAEDRPLIETFLMEVMSEKEKMRTKRKAGEKSRETTETDPFTFDSHYMSPLLKEQLYHKTGVRAFEVQQKVGEAVMIPAGCLRQARYLQSSILVGLDFVSPERLAQTMDWSWSLRRFNLERKGGDLVDDVLQANNIAFFSTIAMMDYVGLLSS